MLGLGEQEEEVFQTMRDLRAVNGYRNDSNSYSQAKTLAG
jgi:lipoate synthase